jgi:hypothetical protein
MWAANGEVTVSFQSNIPVHIFEYEITNYPEARSINSGRQEGNFEWL